MFLHLYFLCVENSPPWGFTWLAALGQLDFSLSAATGTAPDLHLYIPYMYIYSISPLLSIAFSFLLFLWHCLKVFYLFPYLFIFLVYLALQVVSLIKTWICLFYSLLSSPFVLLISGTLLGTISFCGRKE